ncbi:MAG TPA: hypothetical protein VHF26_03410 [Trebonia sp.]|nr:hypothetical protein [Trebonia sp.]
MLIRREAAADAAVIHAVTAAAFARPAQPPGAEVPEARLVGELRVDPRGSGRCPWWRSRPRER